MSDTKRFKMDVPHLQKWLYLLSKEKIMTKALLQHFAFEKNGHLAQKSFDTLCKYYSLCDELIILIYMFLEEIAPRQSVLELHQLEYLTFKKIATTVSQMKKQLKADYNVCLEIN